MIEYSLWQDDDSGDGGFIWDCDPYSPEEAVETLKRLAADPEYANQVRDGTLCFVNINDISDEAIYYAPPQE